MSEDFADIVDNLRRPSAWIRVVFMVAFAVFLYIIIAPVILVLVIAQALFAVITGRENGNLRYLGSALTTYVSQILNFITYNSETKPFPFADFPGGGEQTEAAESMKKEEVNSPGEPAVAKPAPRGKATNKAAVKKSTKKSAAKKSAN